MNLLPGLNIITFKVKSRLQGEQKVTGKIFLWDYRTKIIISDVDGTITKSDVLGHVLPRFGNDWAHAGICQLFQEINANGYQILYLTARAIGQANTTRLYIEGLNQGGVRLPEGPMVMSPDRLMRSFKREVILRKPQVFKIACLKNIVRLFPESNSPFYCGFGNRETDAVSYREVGIPDSKIFIVNPYGELYNYEAPQYMKTYTMLTEIVTQMFPPVIDRKYVGALSSLFFWQQGKWRRRRQTACVHGARDHYRGPSWPPRDPPADAELLSSRVHRYCRASQTREIRPCRFQKKARRGGIATAASVVKAARRNTAAADTNLSTQPQLPVRTTPPRLNSEVRSLRSLMTLTTGNLRVEVLPL